MNQPTEPLTGKTALVTGAATGIGKAIAAALAADGARVVINHPHTPGLSDPVVAQIEEAGGSAIAIAIAAISDRTEYPAMVERMLAAYGRWDVLVNNAAVAITKPFAKITEAEFDLSFAVNVKGVFHDLQLAWALSRAEACGMLAALLARPVRYVPVHDEVARSAMLGAGLNDWFADALIELYQDYRRSVTGGTPARFMTPSARSRACQHGL